MQLRAKFGNLPNQKALMQRHMQGGGPGRKCARRRKPNYASHAACLPPGLTPLARPACRYFDSADWAKDAQVANASEPSPAAAGAEPEQPVDVEPNSVAERPPPLR